MEKYRQFEDQTKGINPFIISKKPSKCTLLTPIIFFIGTVKFLSFIIFYVWFVLLKFLLSLPVINFVLMPLDYIIVKLYTRILLACLGVYFISYKYKKHAYKTRPNLIISSQSSLIDWLVLLYNYNMQFLCIKKSDNDLNDSLLKISAFSWFFYAAGIRFPKVDKKDKGTVILDVINKGAVLFPEGTKSNRLAVLKIRSNVMSEIYGKVVEGKIRIRSEIVVNKNSYFNTTDTLGVFSLFSLCQSIYTPIEIISQDIPSATYSAEDFDSETFETTDEYFDHITQEFLMEPSARNVVNLGAKEHEMFLEYYKKTSGDRKGKYVELSEDAGKMTEFDYENEDN